MKSTKKGQLFLAVVFGCCLIAAPACFGTTEHGVADTAKSTHIKVQEVKTVDTQVATTGHVTTGQISDTASAHGGPALNGQGGEHVAAGGHDAHGSSLTPAKLKDFFWLSLNFLALVFVLVRYGAKPISNALKGRSEKIKNELDDLQAKRDEAEKSLKEFEASLAGMEQELDTVVARAVKQAEAEKAKILEDAERVAADIKKQAESAIQSELAAAKIDLQDDVAEQASVMAEELIVKNLTPEDHSNIIENYLDRVGAAQ